MAKNSVSNELLTHTAKPGLFNHYSEWLHTGSKQVLEVICCPMKWVLEYLSLRVKWRVSEADIQLLVESRLVNFMHLCPHFPLCLDGFVFIYAHGQLYFIMFCGTFCYEKI
jgi:hypothetical protein